jgi:hypothetical protein
MSTINPAASGLATRINETSAQLPVAIIVPETLSADTAALLTEKVDQLVRGSQFSDAQALAQRSVDIYFENFGSFLAGDLAKKLNEKLPGEYQVAIPTGGGLQMM